MISAYGLKWGRKGDFLRTINTYCIAFALCGAATEFIKNYVGYFRPIFFHECNPNEDYTTCQGDPDENYDVFDVSELSKSFVSGHASLAFCGGVLFSRFLEQTIGLSSVELVTQQSTLCKRAFRKPPALYRWGSVLALSPMTISIWVACSRLVDNVHFPADVVGGSVLGATIAYYCHPIWYTDPRYLP